MGDSFLLQAIIYLAAAVVCVPIMKKLGMSSVLGYLIAGMLIGPYLLGFVGKEGEDIMHFAEFGVVMMLFLIGLELEPKNLWKMRNMIAKVGLMQVVVTSLVLFGIMLAAGYSWQVSTAISLSLSLSSTAIVLQSLKEKNLMGTPAGRNSFAVLLMQDIAVIPILAILPLLVVAAPQLANGATESHVGESPISHFPGWIQTLLVLAAVTSIVLAGRYLIAPMLRVVARTKLRELFVASALLIVVGIAYLMEMVGLSPALGTFLAGVVLANSQFKHELESDLDPFKGLLLGLFFIAVGASINFGLIEREAVMIISITFLVMLVKIIVLWFIGKSEKLSTPENLIFAIGLAQVGEFSFVTYSFASQLGIMGKELMETAMAVTALSMTITPFMNLALDKFILPKFNQTKKDDKEPDEVDEKNKVILAGFGHFGSTVARFLRANGVHATVLDNDADQVNLLTKYGFKVFYGDATRHDLMETAGAADARILVSAIDDVETNLQLIEMVKRHFPNLKMMIRVNHRMDAYELLSEAQDVHVYRDHTESSVRLGSDVLKSLGFRSYTVARLAQDFLAYDEASLLALARFKDDEKEHIRHIKKDFEIQEDLIASELHTNYKLNDKAWDIKLRDSDKGLD